VIVSGQALTERFEIRRRLGAGGMGEVFEAFDRERRERVALKTLSNADPHTLTRFKREFRVLQTISHHNLVALGELVRDEDRWFFTMELVEGYHFLEYVRARPGADGGYRYDEARLRECLAQLVRGLRALHAAGMVHRDVKPSNVMVTEDGRVVLLDFGLVTDADPARQSTDGLAVGTVDYMAPEQATGLGITESADWYAVGILLYEALTGRLPYSGHLLQILINKQQIEPVPVEDVAPGLPDDLTALCRDLLRIEPDLRLTGAAVAARLGVADEVRHATTSPLIGASSVFVGRDRELRHLGDAWERARAAPVVQMVVGDSGIGKSTLVHHFARTIVESDPTVAVLQGRCYERESVPFKALDGVADGMAQYLVRMPSASSEALLPPRASLLPRLFPVFQQVDAVASAPSGADWTRDPVEQRSRMFTAFRTLLTSIAASTRVVALIDDLQWADADSFLLLRELLRGRDAPRVLVIATVRGDAATATAIAERLAGVPAESLVIGPLGDDDSRALASRLMPRVAERVDVDRLCREAGGHPLFLQELLRHIENVGALTAAPQLDDALWSRMGLLGADARTLVELVCIAGAPIAREVAMSACRIDGVAFERAASSLRVASLARETRRGRDLALEPYHDRVRESVMRRLDPASQRQLHTRLAIALERTEHRDPQLLLRHFLLAGVPDRAVRYAEEAAQRSMEAHAFDQAADLWKVALDLVTRDPDEERTVRLRLGEALVMAGRGAEAAEHYLAAADGADPATRLECHRHAAEQLLISGRIERGVATLEALLAEIDVSVPATPRAAVASLIWNRGKLRLRGLGFRERHRREIADADLARLDILGVAAHGLAMVDSIRGADFQLRHLMLALRTGHRRDIARAMVVEAMFQATQIHVGRARALLERAREIGGGDDLYLKGTSHCGSALIAYFSGDLATCVEHFDEGVQLLRQVPGATWELVSARIFTVYALRFVGDFLEMRTRYDQLLVDAELRGDQYLSSSIRRASTPMWLAEDAPDEALRDIERATWVPSSRGFHVQHFHELTAYGEVALYTGVHQDGARLADMFRRLDESLLRRVASIRLQTAYLQARLALVEGTPKSLRRAEHLAADLGKSPQPMAGAWSQLIRGCVAVHHGDSAAARAAFDRAEQVAHSGTMRLTAAVARLRRAALVEGDAGAALDADARAELAGLGVRKPDKMAAMIAPLPPKR